jgi:hypothetical protein
MSETPDDLAGLLEPHPATSTPALRDALLRQTDRRLALDRWLRRGTQTALVALVFVVGGLLGWFIRPERERTIELAGPVQTIVVPVPLPVPMTEHSPPAPIPVRAASSAEMQAEQQDNPATAATLYRQAGDAYLHNQDYPNATRCYRLYLVRAGDPALALDSTDSWLLVSLKNAAFKEKFDDAKNDG